MATSTKKVKSSYTTTSGQKVTNYTDGTKKVSGPVTNTAKVGDVVNGQKVKSTVGGNAYASGKDVPGYYDTKDGKNVGMSSGKDIYGNVINASSLKPNGQIIIPRQSPVQGMTGVMDTINAGLAAGSGGTYDTKTKQIVPAPTTDNSFKALTEQLLGANADAFDDMPTNEDRLKEQQKYLRPKEALVNSLAGQINVITQNRDAEILKLEGQGRGQTQGFIGGEQARISREAAIQAMPIQAQLAIAQDDLESARSYASQLFQAQSQDAQNRYNYQKEVNNTIFNYLNEEQKRVMAVKEKAEDRAFAIEQSNRNILRNLSMQAIEYGQGALAGEIMRGNPASQTFDSDISDYMRRLRKPVSSTVKAPDIQNFGTSDKPVWRQYNPGTGQWDPVSGINGGGMNSLQGQQEYNAKKAAISDDIARATELLGNSLGIKSSAGTYQPNYFGNLFTGSFGVKQKDGLIQNLAKYVPVIGNFIGASTASTEKDDFLSGVSYIVNNQTFDKLTSLKADGATFGALSDSERVAIGRAATDLAASVITDESGNITGFRGSETKLVSNLQKVLEGYKAAQDQLNIEYGLSPLDADEAITYWLSLPQ